MAHFRDPGALGLGRLEVLWCLEHQAKDGSGASKASGCLSVSHS